MLLKLLFAFVPLFCAQVVSQPHGNAPERHLINFNKVNIGNLAALDIMMKQTNKYARAHVVFNGVNDVRGAAGHFYHFFNELGHKSLPFTTYGGRDPPEDGEWYESGFLGAARDFDCKGLEEIQIKEGVVYDIHQVAPTRPEQHQALRDKIYAGGGRVGSVYVQKGHDSQIEGDYVQAENLPELLNGIYGDSEDGVVFMSNKSLDIPEISVPYKLLKGRLPPAHLTLATKDPFVANTLVKVSAILKENPLHPNFIPTDRHRQLLRDREDKNFILIRNWVSNAVRGLDEPFCEHLIDWVKDAQEKGSRIIKGTSDDQKRLRIEKQVDRLDEVLLKLTTKRPNTDLEVEFADALFTTARLSDKYELVDAPHRVDEASTSSHSGGHSSSTNPERSKQEASSPSKAVRTYLDLPRDELISMALTYFPEKDDLQPPPPPHLN
ncbi:hypothetical protein FA10DRAFT_262168 [Acaromyces ingoldii]|uniref:Uncharacterized protein n=1 Tax=Acaromyces ingoldii TaxID=215250 RepID=A0A316YF34_9BASI|nr:hypothetical protein FA10DRAFT_262168 [Acaromyces ingoldii]PWN87686.1 hypothetical protein FA10DRAFT_262168 [Acaromyces ingoldii]